MSMRRSHNRPNPAAIETRKNDPLVGRLRAIRRQHRISQLTLASCMNLPQQAIKKIEDGLQQLPGVQKGSGPSLHEWIEIWLACVEASPGERQEVEDLLMFIVIGRTQQQQA